MQRKDSQSALAASRCSGYPHLRGDMGGTSSLWVEADHGRLRERKGRGFTPVGCLLCLRCDATSGSSARINVHCHRASTPAVDRDLGAWEAGEYRTATG